MKKILVLLLSALIMLGNLSGCASTSTTQESNSANSSQTEEKAKTEEQKTYKVVVLMPNAGDPYYQNKSYGYKLGKEAAESEFPAVKIDVKLYDAGGYQNASKQVSQMEDAITQGADAIILTPCDSEALVPVTKQALEKGIVVINDDIKVNTECTSEIRENSYRSGVNVGNFLVHRLGFKGNILMMKGPAGADLFLTRAQGILDELAHYPDIKILDQQFQEDDITAGKGQIEDWIQRFGKDINGIYIHGSVQAVAAAESFKAAGFKPGEVEIVSYDFTDEALDYLREGWITGLVPCQPVKVAKTAVLFAVRALNGVEIPKTIYTTDDFPISAEDLSTFDTSDCMAPAGWKPQLN